MKLSPSSLSSDGGAVTSGDGFEDGGDDEGVASDCFGASTSGSLDGTGASTSGSESGDGAGLDLNTGE